MLQVKAELPLDSLKLNESIVSNVRESEARQLRSRIDGMKLQGLKFYGHQEAKKYVFQILNLV